MEASLDELVSNYNELNGSTVEELDAEPSPLEFMRFVSRNVPFIVRGGAASWKAVRDWNYGHLTSVLQGQPVNVAVTPYGNADSPTFSPEHDCTVLAKPHEESQHFDHFLSYLIRQETDPTFSSNSEVRYAQTQNDNLRDEYLSLFPEAQRDIPFARIALQKPPDAINLWIGNSKSVTATHKDNFENIYVQVLGRKHFVLLPPLCHPCMNERMMPQATYARDGNSFSLQLDEGAEPVPFATWDPDHAQVNPTAHSHLARPIRLTLEPGDMLYLPAMWYAPQFTSPILPFPPYGGDTHGGFCTH
ncbi:Transcription factor jumonji/aspartyl beta-hydroxylase [Drechmeria coniospora]|uniref:Transcription factor jumonji/aspartyl beta-hydroxylase n=1 Tax=Drechmeria coniospora TaxID=98403 RepID=A0A151GB83_DRECN|nr:Transcription factor jumonji/aspartyl beta-hydroxylase [Drechmeria coniospora]KYK54305.1 Transcription factor jumonji/aspartyl beta-hydroxylase [Drechmeria coniospora]